MRQITVYPGQAEAEKRRRQEAERERRAARQRSLTARSLTPEWAREGRYYLRRLADAPFWCGDETKHKDSPDRYWMDLCCTEHAFGLPRHRITNEPCPPAPHQLKFAEDVIEARRRSPHQPLFHHLNKGRQMGFTEVVVRILAHQGFSAYAGRNVGIMAATNGRLARKDLLRLYNLFAHIPQVLEGPVRGNSVRMRNGTVFEAYAASEEAATGLTQYGGFFLDEAAKWKLIEDKPVFNSVEPIIRSSAADLFLVSTPKGPQKTFWRIHKEPRDYRKHLYTIWEAEGSMYTAEEIKHMIATTQADPQQEYLCQFTIGEDSVFGLVDDDERVPVREWDWDGQAAASASEDDSYRPARAFPQDGEWPIG